MAFEVTATRRRPKTFDELAGQEFVVATLKSSITSGRIAHAYLFSGPRGCGKTSAARILARSLNCERGPTATPCGICTNCQEIQRGASLDVIEIDGASNTSVNDVRQIKDEVLFPPNSGKYKVYIIDEVHMLSNSAFNALLKTIEEPPPYIIFIFATTELHKVPATIKSRCQQFAFRLIPIETIKNILAEACTEMGIQADDEALFWIAKESTGSLRDAYTLFDQVVAFSEGHIRTELIREKLGLVGFDAINNLAEACAQEQTAEAFTLLDAILQQGISVEQFVIDLAEYYRSLLLIKQGIHREALIGYSVDRFSPRVLETLSSAQIEQGLSILLNVYRDIRYSLSPRYELETAISRLCWLRRWIAPSELKAAVEQLQGIVRGSPENPYTGVFQTPIDESIGSSILRKTPDQTDILTNPAVDRPAVIDHTAIIEQAAGTGNAPISGSLSSSFRQYLAAKAEVKPSPELDTRGGPPQSYLGASTVETKPPSESAKQEACEAQPAPSSESQHQVSATANNPVDIETVRNALIEHLKKDRGLLASSLQKTDPWAMSEQKLTIPVRDSLSLELLNKEKHLISGALHQLGYNEFAVEFTNSNPTPDSQGNNALEPDIPPAVETVRRLFRGTIVRIK
ncbi:MAG: DNA polymerase III subunit gamma/tau [Termitinemataceae bacterium]